MKKSLYPLLLFVLFPFVFNGCYYDNEEYLYPKTICDTSNVTFSGTIDPILKQNCASCHSGANALGHIRLDSYSNDSIYASNGRLGGSVNQTGGYRKMPEGLPKLDDCTLAKINLWIKKGYPNN